MAEGILLQDLYEDFHSFKKTTENHMQNTESQFHTIRVEIQAMRRQMEAMMQQFSSLASDMDKEINAISAGPSNQGENSRQQQLITSNIFDGGRDLLDPYHGIFKVFKQSFMEWQDLIAREEEESAVEMEETVAVPLPTVPINVENLRGFEREILSLHAAAKPESTLVGELSLTHKKYC
ncbi:hypothetical protein I3843_06G083100 [Carya illinoinensis]|nr:hypothetical protein I3760_06G089300 [Carya illinoinensis]KAG7975145.1 hypothetical protein I3843_06G083100 [Carya illinoinensis]